MDQGQITSVLQDSIQPSGRNRTENIRAESSSDDEESSDEENVTMESSSDADDGNNNHHHSSGVDPLAALKSGSEYLTLIKDNFPSEVVLAGLVKYGGTTTPNLDELTEWCFDHHTDEEIQDILTAYCREQGQRPKNSGHHAPAVKEVTEMLPPPSTPPTPPLRMENQFIIPVSSGGALLLSQQFAFVWDQFLAEVERVTGAEDHLSFLVLAKGLEALTAQVGPLNRSFFSQFHGGRPNLVRVVITIK